MTKAIIFDLDSCLAAADEGRRAVVRTRVCGVRAANDGSWRATPPSPVRGI